MQARKKINDQGIAASQHTFNTVDGSVVESAGTAEAEALTSAIAVAKAAAAHQGEVVQRQDVVIRNEDRDQADDHGRTAPRHPEYQQLQEMLDEFMTEGHHDNSTTIINNSIYRNNVIIKSRAMNLLHATSKAPAREGLQSPRSLTAGGEMRAGGGPSRWSLPGSLNQTGLNAEGDGCGAREDPIGGQGMPQIRTPMLEDKAVKAAPNDAGVPRAVNIRVKSAAR